MVRKGRAGSHATLAETPAKPAEPAVTEIKPSSPPVEGVSFDGLPGSIDAPYTKTRRAPVDALTDTPAFVRERLADALSAGRHTDKGFIPKFKLQEFNTPEQAAEFVRLGKRYGKAAERTVYAYQVTKDGDAYKPDDKGLIVRYTMRPRITRNK
jgi:hypothetical protein